MWSIEHILSSRATTVILPAALLALAPVAPASADSYEVFARPKEYPDDGPRSVEVDPALGGGAASPFGWHDTNGMPGADHTITRGNNAHAYTDLDGDDLPDAGGSPDGGAALDFLFPLDLADPPADYRAAAVTNAFYWTNLAHDVLYRYGFDEAAGNFQQNNYGRGGADGDPFLVEVQDGSFTNGLTVSTPVDGESPRMELAVFTLTSPDRDSALSSYVLMYAYARAVTTRLVGGPADASCLSTAESLAMTVGWADWLALVLTADSGESATTSRGVGTYIFGQPPTGAGIREAPYSTDLQINPLTYGSLGALSSPYGTGSVWATVLWQLYWELVQAHGFNPDIYADWTSGGNNLALQLIIDAMKLSPCDPGFVDGRDAILQADAALSGGANRCLIWNAFAERGLGFSAEQGSAGSITDGVEAFDIPPECLGTAVAPAECGLRLGAVAPNPFGAETSIHYTLPRAARVTLSIHDSQGREVVRLVDEARPAGDHVVRWNGRAAGGRRAGSGVYFLRIRTDGDAAGRKIVLSR